MTTERKNPNSMLGVIASVNSLTKVSKVRMFGSDRNEIMSSSPGSSEAPQLPLVRKLDFDPPNRCLHH
jgi:hypothetical protein